MTTHIPGTGDAPLFYWQIWWNKYALLDLHRLPYTTDMIYYPLTDVPVMAQTPLNEILLLPLLVATNLTIFYNILFLASYILSGYFTYLLGRALRCRPAIAFVGGLIFAFCAYRGMRGLGHLSLLTTQWMPLTLLLAFQCWRRPTIRQGVALGTAAALTTLASPYHIGLFLLPVGIAALLTIALQRRQRILDSRIWRSLVAAAAILALFVIPFYLHYVYLDVDIYTLTAQLGLEIATNSADLLSWLLPPALNPLWGQWTAPIYAQFSTPNLMETTLFVGFLPVILFGISWIVRRPSTTLRFWQLLVIVSLVLALGPVLHIHGKAIIDGLPYRWLLQLPGFDGFRIPSRAGITTALALSVLAMLVTQQLYDRYHRQGRRWYSALTLFVIGYFLTVTPFFPHPIIDMRVPRIYEALVTIDPQLALLELPAGEFVNNGFNYFTKAGLWMTYQAVHHRRTVSGYLARRPARLYEPERTLPFVRRFFHDTPGELAVDRPELQGLPEPLWPDDVMQADQLLAQVGIGAVAIHCRPANERDYCYNANILLTQAVGLPIAVEGQHRLYQVTAPAYQTRALLPTHTELVPEFDAAFAPVTYTPGRRTHRMNQTGTITVTAPIAGAWAIQGLLSGPALAQAQFMVDGVPVTPAIDHLLANTDSWRIERQWAQGPHALTIALPNDAALAEDEECPRLCLHNFSARLMQPSLLQSVTSEAMVRFVNAQGQEAHLFDAYLYRETDPIPTAPISTEMGEPSTQPLWLITAWQVNRTLQDQLVTTIEAMPSLYVHIQDPAGQLLGQADHYLGEHHLLITKAGVLYDLIALPDGIEPSNMQITLGLWHPTRAEYYWNPAASADRDATAYTLPSLPIVTR